jgi:hypothetical protein
MGGIVTGIRSIVTKTKTQMAVVTMEDLQGTVEVVVFPKTYETTLGTWRDGAILLVAGRVDHRGEDVQILADSVWDWDLVAEGGPEAFAREVGSLDKRSNRRGPGGPGGPGGNSFNGNSNRGGRPSGQGSAPASQDQQLAKGPAPMASSAAVAVLPRVAPGAPMPTYAEPPGLVAVAGAAGREEAEEPPLPDETRNRAAAADREPSSPVEAPSGAVLHVHFARAAGTDRVLAAMQAFRLVLRERPGATRVVVHVPAPGGEALPMELRGVAYDADLVAEVRRRVGDGVVDLRLT